MCLCVFPPITHQLTIINVGWRNEKCLSLAQLQREVFGHCRVADGHCNIFFIEFVEATIVKLSGGKTKLCELSFLLLLTLVPVWFTSCLRRHLVCRELHAFTAHTQSHWFVAHVEQLELSLGGRGEIWQRYLHSHFKEKFKDVSGLYQWRWIQTFFFSFKKPQLALVSTHINL